MADLPTSSDRSLGKVRSKKFSTRIDMTPMVDLAFLLLTFFILTTSLTKKFVMRIDMPDEPEAGINPPPINAKRVLTLILSDQDKIYWNSGIHPEIDLTGFSRDGIRNVLIDSKAKIKNMYVMIKPSDQSHYRNLIDILDEMTITGIERYAVVDVTPEDRHLFEKAFQASKPIGAK